MTTYYIPTPQTTARRTCAWDGCNRPSTGKSKYCAQHKREARAAWIEKVQAQQAERKAAYDELARIFQEADQAGRAAAQACTPTPITVVEHSNPLDDSSPVVKRYGPYEEGVCGFAWITIRPGTCRAAHYAKKHWGASRAYTGGVRIWISDYGQSYERKRAYAGAFASVLQKHGIRAYADGRLD